ncbi:unnamed protein product [Rotaria socialis]|uniref:Transmembrane protein 45B-like n=1 Tax=Rotaria socialis TaxID=392032 RepID=A0A817KWM4_9BILA|nr:unnamed protein product [Rotaria socialis]CAF3248936.1 unnamed protein product [Rotaria socialis]CAF3304648.1 unnamed protein product [Rotaria socialis]CAF3653593.1 unnamed protein product [Rotaria socialis]CAF3747853.1 unnamed protein product [Rotaria socialis]
MGTLMGHILPGTFFAIFAIWWGFCVAVKHFHSRHSRNKTRKPNSYRSSTTFSCLCCPSSSLREIPLESYIKLICIIIGILGESVTGLKHPYDDTLKRKIWTFEQVNAQHIAMFFSFGLASFIEILVNAKYNLPKGIEFLANIFAFGVEGFLFHFHLHGRNEIDIHVHTLLVYNIGFCILAGIWEFNRPNQILATYCRIIATLLQGAWFYAAGFILYFPSDDPYWIWSASHGNILIITVMFIWLGILSIVFLLLQSLFVWKLLKRRYGSLSEYSMINNNDDDDEIVHEEGRENSNNHQLKPYKTNNGNTSIHVNNDDDGGGDSDSQIEFEQQKFTSKI